MKPVTYWLSMLALILTVHAAEEESRPADPVARHAVGAREVADAQDELSADVQQLAIEQSLPKVIELLNEVETIMDEATDRLSKADTGGQTLAAQTEIIEKIHAAAKERQSQSGGSQAGGAMMDMMERMMGKTSEGKGKGQKGDKPGDSGGQGQTGASDTANENVGGESNAKNEARRVPKASGNGGLQIPAEYRQAMDAYNRGLEGKRP